MRQLRRCMLVVLCVCVMGALTGCGNDNADNKATDYNGDRTNDATNGTADDTKNDDGVADDPVLNGNFFQKGAGASHNILKAISKMK